MIFVREVVHACACGCRREYKDSTEQGIQIDILENFLAIDSTKKVIMG